MKLKYKGRFWKNTRKGSKSVSNNFIRSIQLRRYSAGVLVVAIELDNNTANLTATGSGPKDQQGIHLEYEKNGKKFDCYLEFSGFDSRKYTLVCNRVKKGYEVYFIKRGREVFVQEKSFRVHK